MPLNMSLLEIRIFSNSKYHAGAVLYGKRDSSDILLENLMEDAFSVPIKIALYMFITGNVNILLDTAQSMKKRGCF